MVYNAALSDGAWGPTSCLSVVPVTQRPRGRGEAGGKPGVGLCARHVAGALPPLSIPRAHVCS